VESNINLVYPSQGKANVDEVIKIETKTTQPTLWCSLDNEGLLYHAFAVVDKAVFIDVSDVTFLNALLALMGVYIAFNLSYDKWQELVFKFIEEFVLGLHPAKTYGRYRTMCMLLLPDNWRNNYNAFAYILVLPFSNREYHFSWDNVFLCWWVTIDICWGTSRSGPSCIKQVLWKSPNLGIDILLYDKWHD